MENKLNLFKFYAGQKVAAINSGSSGSTRVKKGQPFTVLRMAKCECGKKFIDIGFKTDTGGPSICKEGCMCSNDDTLWVNESGFVPIEEQKFPLMTFEKIKETEKEEILIPN